MIRRLSIALLLASPVSAASTASPPSFAAILWHSDLPPAALAALPGLGITAGRVFGERDHFDQTRFRESLVPLRNAGLGVMVENVATDFYAAYHRWQGPMTPVNAAFLVLLDRVRAHRDDPTIWARQPSLDDNDALALIEARLTAHARAMADHPALYLSLGDETGIADLSAASDLDQAPPALSAWTASLRHRYGTIGALDRDWKTQFGAWNAVHPTSTDDAIDGSRSVAAWMDLKAWTDAAFAADVARGTAAVHRGDANARAGLEGAQRPGWGGYDYSNLASAVDVMEIGEVGATTSIARGFAPYLKILTTSVAADAAEEQRLWRFVLLGGSGIVLWDPDHTIVRHDGVPGPRGLRLKPILAGLQGNLGRRLIAAVPAPDNIGILYSQASFRLRWLLDRRADRARGLDWTRRDNETDLADSPWRNALIDLVATLGHLGRNPTWLDAASLRPASLTNLRTILLPQAIALDDRTIAALRAFTADGGLLIADVEPGLYDALARARPRPPLARVRRVPRFETATLVSLIPPSARLDDRISIFRLSGGILAIQRDTAGPPFDGALVVGGLRCPIHIEQAAPTVLHTRTGLCPEPATL